MYLARTHAWGFSLTRRVGGLLWAFELFLLGARGFWTRDAMTALFAGTTILLASWVWKQARCRRAAGPGPHSQQVAELRTTPGGLAPEPVLSTTPRLGGT